MKGTDTFSDKTCTSVSPSACQIDIGPSEHFDFTWNTVSKLTLAVYGNYACCQILQEQYCYIYQLHSYSWIFWCGKVIFFAKATKQVRNETFCQNFPLS